MSEVSMDIARVLNEDNPTLVKRIYQSGDQVYGLDLYDNLVFLAKVVPGKNTKHQKSALKRVDSGTAVFKRATRSPRIKRPDSEASQQTGTDEA